MSKSLPSQKLLELFPPLDPRSDDAVLLQRLSDLVVERAVDASLAVKGRRVAASPVFQKI